MSNVQKMKEWLIANTKQTEPDVEWYLAMWYAQQTFELTWKDRAHEIASQIASPPTYEYLAGQFLDGMKVDGTESYEIEAAQDFYGE